MKTRKYAAPAVKELTKCIIPFSIRDRLLISRKTELNSYNGRRLTAYAGADPDNKLTGFQQWALSSFPVSQLHGGDLISLNVSSQIYFAKNEKQ